MQRVKEQLQEIKENNKGEKVVNDLVDISLALLSWMDKEVNNTSVFSKLALLEKKVYELERTRQIEPITSPTDAYNRQLEKQREYMRYYGISPRW